MRAPAGQACPSAPDATLVARLVSYAPSSKGLFPSRRPRDRLQTRLSESASGFSRRNRVATHLEVRIPGEYIDTNTPTRDSSTFRQRKCLVDGCGNHSLPEAPGAYFTRPLRQPSVNFFLMVSASYFETPSLMLLERHPPGLGFFQAEAW